MAKKNDRLCWNCDANVNLLLTHCPYCGVDLAAQEGERVPYSMASSAREEAIPAPPYATASPHIHAEPTLSKEEWNQALKEEEGREEAYHTTKSELLALLLLLPGIVFLLFGFALFLFSHDGVLTLQWNQGSAYLYLLGALPLLFFGWRSLNK